MITGIRHTGIVVMDMMQSIDFYCNLLGFVVYKTLEESGQYLDAILANGEANHIFTQKLRAPNGTTLDLISVLSEIPLSSERHDVHDYFGLSHIALQVDDIDAEYARLTKAGVRFKSIPHLSPDGFAAVCFCLDPDNNPIELVQVMA